MHITDLGGHSGCKVLLCEEGDRFFVRKISGSKEYNHRLKVQAQKQKNFCNGFVKAPAVLKTGWTEDQLFYFDMEYIQGIVLAEYMKVIETGRVRGIAETVISNIAVPNTGTDECDEGAFCQKIDSLKVRLLSAGNPVVNEALQLLGRHSWKKFHPSLCHGDLTLENIIVKDSQLYLIDFLDSFYDSWLLDVGTLLQDVQTLWSYRAQGMEIEINTLIRLIIFRDVLLDKVREIGPELVTEVYYALLLKLVRIFPYVKDRFTYDYLNEKIMSVMKVIEKDGADI